MARNESDREDLMREATALVNRAELNVEGFDEPVVVGFRRNGSVSIFFGADPVYQFNTSHQLRRAYLQGDLLKAEKASLVKLTRQRSDTQVLLVRHPLNDVEQQAVLGDARQAIRKLVGQLGEQRFEQVGEVCEKETDVVAQFLDWCRQLPDVLSVASTPHAK